MIFIFNLQFWLFLFCWAEQRPAVTPQVSEVVAGVTSTWALLLPMDGTTAGTPPHTATGHVSSVTQYSREEHIWKTSIHKRLRKGTLGFSASFY